MVVAGRHKSSGPVEPLTVDRPPYVDPSVSASRILNQHPMERGLRS